MIMHTSNKYMKAISICLILLTLCLVAPPASGYDLIKNYGFSQQNANWYWAPTTLFWYSGGNTTNYWYVTKLEITDLYISSNVGATTCSGTYSGYMNEQTTTLNLGTYQVDWSAPMTDGACNDGDEKGQITLTFDWNEAVHNPLDSSRTILLNASNQFSTHGGTSYGDGGYLAPNCGAMPGQYATYSGSDLPPPLQANFQFGPHGDTAPGQFTAYDTSTGGPPNLWSWTILPNTGITMQNATTSELTIQAQYPGNYSVRLYVQDDYSSSNITKYLNLGTAVNVTPRPSPSITPYPTITGLQTIATLPTGLPTIINKTDYKTVIESGLIGNLTAPVTDMMDDIADAITSFATTVLGYLLIPFTFITANMGVAINLFGDITDPFIHGAHWILYIIGQAIAALPPGGEEIGSLVLIGGIFYTVMRGRMGNG